MPRNVHALGSRFRVVRVGLPSMVFSKNNQTRLELPNGLIQKKLTLRLTGGLAVGVSNATIFSEAPLGLIRKVELVGDGRRYLCSADGRDIWHLARRMHRKKLELAAPAATFGGTNAFSATMILDAEALNFADGSESILDTRIFKKLELVITWGSETDIATAGGGGGTISIDPTTAIDIMDTQTAEGVHKIIFDHVLAQSEKAVVATSSDFLFDDIPQSGLLAGILFRVTRDAGAGAGPVPVDNVINTVSIVSDVSIRHVDKIKWRTLQSHEVAQFLIDGGDATTGQEVGYAYLDLSESGMFSSALNINALNKAQIRLDVTRTSGTELVHALYDFFEPRGDATAELTAA